LIASIMLFSCLMWLSTSIETLANLYQSQYRLEGLGFMGFLALMLLGATLGSGGAWFAVSRHLRDIEPR
jgi:cell division transport system permease protein